MEMEAYSVDSIYKTDEERRQRLGEMVQRVQEALRGLDMKLELEKAEHLYETVTRSTFKILVLGEFNTGKSTFINALLGKEVLPTKATPATAIINEVRWGEQEAARLYFRDEEKDPIDIPVDTLVDYVTIEDSEDEIRESPYSHAEIWWPLPLLQNNVELIDSPGLNESDVREQVTQNYLSQVDAVLFLMTATRFGRPKLKWIVSKYFRRRGIKNCLL